jgi:pimeloyl-ACP methyl ester carboxylesterase
VPNDVAAASHEVQEMKRWAVRAGVRLALGIVGLLLAVVLAAMLGGAFYTPDLQIPADLAGRHVDVLGQPLRVLQQGRGRDVLLIHGSPGLLEDFAPITEALRGSFRLTSYDRPGHGLSADSGHYDLRHNAQVARALIDKLKLERVIVVGHSYGGSTALALAGLKPQQVSAYVVLDSAVYQPIRPAPALYTLLAVPTLGTGLARLLPTSAAGRRIREGITAGFASRQPPAGFVALRTRLWTQPKVTHTLARELSEYAAMLRAQSPQYPAIDAPLYVVMQRDDAARRETGQRLVREVKGAELTLAERTGHYVQIERADLVLDVIRRAAAAH